MDEVNDESHRAIPPGRPSALWQASIGRWLAESVVPVYDATQSEPARRIPAKDVALDALHAEWLSNGGRIA